ncbi:MAG: N-acetylmuramoyl-L-alanine amidase [Sphaerobacter sp.]|nr:N-acetylmuramoyl-L-alanine amidase [Sphaerobacter sp.]
MLRERVNRRTFLKVAGGALLATIVDLRPPEEQAAAMTRTAWVERGVFPTSGQYQSAVFHTEQPYNSIEVGWIADVPEGSRLELAVRTGSDGGWSDWVHLHADPHAQPVNGGRTYAAPVLTGPSTQVQYRVALVPNERGEAPRLHEVEIAAVDTSPPARLLAATPLIDGWIIPRAGWGADESLRFKDGEEVWPPEYAPIQKVIVHHTVTQNRPPDPAAAIRAIYYYHAVTLGWGDIGYNYLIDWDGRVYEGRYGGPGVIGGHALQYNRGSIGIAVLGDFQATAPPQAALDALVRLIRERAGHLDPAGWGPFADRRAVAHICGHRDVLSTECPGDQLYSRLPEVRGWLKGSVPIYVPPSHEGSARLVSVTVSPTTAYVGTALKIEAVVENTGAVTIYGQDPAPGYVYTEGQDFESAGFAKLEGAFRVCVDAGGNSRLPNPYRWGLPGPLPPGQRATVVGYLRLTSTGPRTLTASVVQEFVRYHQAAAFPQQITVLEAPTVPAPRNGDPTMVYLEVTQHNVPRIFWDYWERNGGLLRFGYPLTEPYYETSPIDGRPLLVQYFERARFEHHPEYAGTPYEVLLGLLGREITAGREGEAPFRPLPSATPGPDRDFFPETGHTLAYGFRDYWYRNGGLPIFGYPISEEFQERSKTDGQVHTVQYFERARFEWHPDKRGTPYEVLLGHLGREILIGRGWLKGAD